MPRMHAANAGPGMHAHELSKVHNRSASGPVPRPPPYPCPMPKRGMCARTRVHHCIGSAGSPQRAAQGMRSALMLLLPECVHGSFDQPRLTWALTWSSGPMAVT